MEKEKDDYVRVFDEALRHSNSDEPRALLTNNFLYEPIK